jgi:hypothetical protein
MLSCICPRQTVVIPEREALETLSCKPSNFRKRVRKVINKAK